VGKISEFIVFAAIIWLLWAFFATDKCDRVDRLAAPVRGGMAGVRAVFHNWADEKTNEDLLLRSREFDAVAQQFLATSIYGSDLVCNWGHRSSAEKMEQK
jgi:hypothetical protein